MNVSCASGGSIPTFGGALGDRSHGPSFLNQVSESRHRHCVLLLDDDFVFRAALKAVLRILDVRVVDAGSGQEGLDILRGGLRPCVVFIDPEMPQGGAWLFRACQVRDQQLATIPVAILSARSVCPTTASGLHAIDWLVKPGDVEQMVCLAASYCGADGSHRANEYAHGDGIQRIELGKGLP